MVSQKTLLTLILSSYCLLLSAQNPFGADDATAARYYRAQQAIEDSTQFMLIADSLYTEGETNNEPMKKLMSYDLKSNYFFYIGDEEHICDYITKASDLAKEMYQQGGYPLNMMRVYFTYRNNLGTFYLNSGNLQKASDIAMKNLEEAKEADDVICLFDGYNLMGNVYNELNNYTLALEQYEEVMKVIDRCEQSGMRFPPDRRLYILLSMANIHYQLRDIEKGEKCLQEALAVDPNLVQPRYLRANYCLNRKDKKGFKKLYDEAQQLEASMLPDQGLYLYSLEMMKAASEGQIEQAISMAEQMSQRDIELITNKISIYKWAGQWEKATELSEQLMLIKDSLSNEQSTEIISKMTAEMRTIYETAEKEAEIQQQRFMLYLTGISLVAVLLIIGLLVYRYREVRKKNLALVANINELLDMRKKEQQIRTTPAVVEASSDSEPNLQVQRYIYELTSRKLFCNENFDREELLSELHFPKTGFWKKFEEETGCSVSRYVQNLRMEYAAEQIRLHPEFTIEAIAADCGIPSRATFYRNFATRFGINPSVFREQCM